MGGADDLQQTLHARRGEGLVIIFQYRFERLGGFPFWVLCRGALDLVEGKQQFEVRRLFAPQRAVVVEHSDALGRFDEILAALVGYGLYELDDALFRGAVVP